MQLDDEAAESLFGLPASYEIGENLIGIAVYGPFTFVPDASVWKPERRDSFLEFLDSWQRARNGIVDLSLPTLWDLHLGDTLPGYGYVYQGRVYAFGDEGKELMRR